MAYFQIGDKELQLKTGSQRVGPAGSGADLVLEGMSGASCAVVDVGADQSVIIRRADASASVSVNGIALGAEPTPLMHGDRVELNGMSLRFGDHKQAGSTQFLSGADLAAIAKVRQSLPTNKPTMATGGRLVSLVDGREYTIRSTGLTIGRDPSADVVVASAEVSRKHVMIAPGEQGYVLTDLSTNGVLVNGARVDKTQILGRADVIRVATEEFRFYADAAKATPAPAAHTPVAAAAPVVPATPVAPAAPAAPPPVAAAAPPAAPRPAAPAMPTPIVSQPAIPTAPPPAPARPATPPQPMPVVASAPSPAPTPAPPSAPPSPTPAPPSAPPALAAKAPPQKAPMEKSLATPPRRPLAVLEVLNEGAEKGKRFEVFGPLTNIGRGEHNDLVIASESVSDSHAKLQKREAGWFIVDVDSTNGTYVGGRRVTGEQMLSGAPDLRFGDVKVSFKPTAEAAEAPSSTRVIVGQADAVRRAVAASKPAEPAPVQLPREVVEQTTAAPPKQGGVPGWIWGLLVVAAAVAAYFILGR